MPFSSHRQLKLVHLVRLGFALLLLCMMVTFSANLVANTQYQATYQSSHRPPVSCSQPGQ